MHHIYISDDNTLPMSCGLNMKCVSHIDALTHINSFCWLNCHLVGWEKTAVFLKKNGIPMVAVSENLSMIEMQKALLYGAKAYCLSSIDHDTALAIVATVKRAGLWLPAEFLSSVIGHLSHLKEYHLNEEAQSCLTKREVEVVNEVLEGKTNLAISISLGITERTVKEHISSILHKFSVKDRVGLLLKLGEFKQIV